MKVYAEILGASFVCGGQRAGGSMTASSPEGVRRCVAEAIRQSGLLPEEIDYVNAHLTATGNDPRETAHLRCALQLDGDRFPWINATKSMIGHKEGVNVLADWCQRGVRVIAVTQQIDLSGPVGNLIASLLFGIAEIELHHAKERRPQVLPLPENEVCTPTHAAGTSMPAVFLGWRVGVQVSGGMDFLDSHLHPATIKSSMRLRGDLVEFFTTAELVLLMVGSLVLLGVAIYKLIRHEIRKQW